VWNVGQAAARWRASEPRGICDRASVAISQNRDPRRKTVVEDQLERKSTKVEAPSVEGCYRQAHESV
jgi:hypothetical protein